MAEVTELKSLRSNSKRKLTVLIKKLKNSIQYGKDDTETIHSSLDEEYYKLYDIQLKIEESSGEDDKYMETVDKDYDEISQLYSSSVKASKEIEQLKTSNTGNVSTSSLPTFFQNSLSLTEGTVPTPSGAGTSGSTPLNPYAGAFFYKNYPTQSLILVDQSTQFINHTIRLPLHIHRLKMPLILLDQHIQKWLHLVLLQECMFLALLFLGQINIYLSRHIHIHLQFLL